ncbi:MAG: hypothetical protein KA792_06050 [Bacteroidales bacterium]|nr:hypothetical protein [Bacteroidales bacterium]
MKIIKFSRISQKCLIVLYLFYAINIGIKAQNESSEHLSQIQTTQKKEGNQKFRIGIGGRAGFTLFIPSDINNFALDIWEDYNKYSIINNENNKPNKIFMGESVNMIIFARINKFQAEIFRDLTFAPSINFQLQSNPSYQYSGNYHTYTIQPAYKAYGVNLLYAPANINSKKFIIIGGGIGVYEGIVEYKYATSTSSANISETYKGKNIGYNFILGNTFITNRYIELEYLIKCNLVKINELKNNKNIILKNTISGYKINLNCSGISLNFGIKFIIP